MYHIKTTPTFDEDFKKLSRPVAKRITEKIEELVDHPELLRFPIKYLPEQLAGLQKYRIGDWRVLFWVEHEKKEIILYGVEHRGEVYRRLRKQLH